jgi:putative FmdB family regulatory protein
MPTYEYRCPDGHDFEKFVQKISLAEAELACPVCGKMAERRISAGGGFVFKGSGFYITDYGKDGKKDLRTNAAAAAATAEAGKPADVKGAPGSASDGGGTKSPDAAPAASGAPKADAPAKSSKGDAKAGTPPAPKGGSTDK